jgi:hypothetical protein
MKLDTFNILKKVIIIPSVWNSIQWYPLVDMRGCAVKLKSMGFSAMSIQTIDNVQMV